MRTFLILLAALNLSAHGATLTEIPLSPMEADQYRELFDEGRSSIDPEGASETFVQQLRDKLKFKTMLLNSYRWYSSHRGVPHVENVVANLVAMFLTSHTMETIGGGAMVGSGAGHGFDSWIDKGMAAIGVTIVVPGLDPLCLILAYTYKKWPMTLDRVLTVPRLFLVEGTQAALFASGVPEGYLQSALREKWKQRFLESLGARDSQIKVQFADAQNAEYNIFGSQPGQIISLKMRGRALESVTFTPQASSMVRTYMAQLLAPFGLNIRELVLEMDLALSTRKLEAMANLPYVERVDESSRTVFVKRGAFPFHIVDQAEIPCDVLLQGR